jgi:hypothetical protein
VQSAPPVVALFASNVDPVKVARAAEVETAPPQLAEFRLKVACTPESAPDVIEQY